MKGFHITLPSNASLDLFPKNSLSDFYVKLPQVLELPDQWEVGLSEILFPRGFLNVRKTPDYKIIVHNRGHHDQEFYLEEGYYEDPASLVGAIMAKTSPENDSFEIKFNSENGRVYFRLDEGVKLYFGKNISQMLGFPDAARIAARNLMAPRQANTRFHAASIYIYSDIVAPSPVGDVLAPLLRVIPISGKHSGMTSFVFTNPHYYPVNRKSIDIIQTYITDDAGENITFNSGRCIVILHFQPQE